MFQWLKNTLNRSLFGINILMSVLLVLSYLGAVVPPSKFYFLAILALGYPVLFFINVGFALWWLYRRKRYFYLSTLALVIGYGHMLNFIAFNMIGVHPTDDALKIMSYNVRYFDAPFYRDENKLTQEHQNILDVIKAQGVDIFCGQEFSGKTAAYNKIAQEELAHKMGLKYHYYGGGSSLAIYAKYPIVKKGEISFDNTFNGAIYVDLKLEEGQVLRIYCFHLQSVRLGHDEEEVLNQKNLTTLNQDDTQQKFKRIGGKLKNAFLLREQQVEFISKHILDSPHPVIVCGDMNDTPSSYAYHRLSKGLKDAFRHKGMGVGSTYAGTLPFLRIDYIFASPDVQLQTFQRLSNTSSDHYPIYAQLRLGD